MNFNFSKSIVFFIAVLTLWSTTGASWAELSAKANRTVLDSNETLQLSVRLDAQAFRAEPDFSPLKKEFEILSNNRQQQYSSVNGKAQSYTDWNLTLRPKRTGIILIPSLKYKNQISNAIEITVRTASTAGAGSAGTQPIYTETVVDKAATYIQEQIVLTHRLYTSVQLRDYSLSELDIPGAIIQRIGDSQFQKKINGRHYLVIEVSYAIFPQSSGELTIPALRFGAFETNNRSQFGTFATRGNPIFRDTQAKTINVMPRPAHIAADEWMPSSNIELTEQWSDDLNNLIVGEPITRTIQISAQGLTGAQILPLTIAPNSQFKLYPDQPQLDQQISNNGILGTRTESLALVPNQAGEITLPAIEMRWWDTANERMQTAKLPETTVRVSASTAINNVPLTPNNRLLAMTPLSLNAEPATAENTPPSMLLTLSLAFNALLLAGIAILVLGRGGQPTRMQVSSEVKTSALVTLKEQLKRIEMQAKLNNLNGMRDAILVWGQCLFSETPPTTLKELTELLGDTELQYQFAQLDRQLYKDEVDDLLDIALLLKRLRQQSTFSRSANADLGNGLKPLYPNS